MPPATQLGAVDHGLLRGGAELLAMAPLAEIGDHGALREHGPRDLGAPGGTEMLAHPIAGRVGLRERGPQVLLGPHGPRAQPVPQRQAPLRPRRLEQLSRELPMASKLLSRLEPPPQGRFQPRRMQALQPAMR